jgi:hypothetical protein
MKFVLSISAAVALAGGAAAMAGAALASSAVSVAAALPGYEVAGFPISPVQMQLIGGANVEEQQRAAVLTLNGMPASPHQISVLTPRKRQSAEALISNESDSRIVLR